MMMPATPSPAKSFRFLHVCDMIQPTKPTNAFREPVKIMIGSNPIPIPNRTTTGSWMYRDRMISSTKQPPNPIAFGFSNNPDNRY